jgi:hypothetical protein
MLTGVPCATADFVPIPRLKMEEKAGNREPNRGIVAALLVTLLDMSGIGIPMRGRCWDSS